MPSSVRKVEADVDEIKLKDSFTENTTKRTNSFARALKKRISLTRLNKAAGDKDNVCKQDRYPTFTIEDWETSSRLSKSKEFYPSFESQTGQKDDVKSDCDAKSDLGIDFDSYSVILDPDRDIEDNKSVKSDDVMSDTSDKNYRLSVDSSMVQNGRVRFYKRLSICDLKDGHTMDPKERVFLEAAERGDKHTMMRCLASPYPVNVNCTDILGRSAIQIAVDNENVEIVELLLNQDSVRIGDALLYSITEGVYKIVEMLINHPSITPEMLANDWSKVRQTGEESSDFDPNISPIILAAHCNQFEILQLFLSRGAYIDKPHSLSCACRICTEGFHVDSLRYSLRRIHTYRALASPAWISLTSEDPILAAFKLSWELERLARVENEFKDTYLELSEMCKKYTCDLLHQCRSTREVIAVLNRRSDEDEDDDDEDDNDDDPSRLTLSRLKLALKYNQKQFVAHPNCQQLLTSVWYEGLPVWRRRNALVKILICISIIVFMPLIALTYLLFPKTRVGRVLRSPFMKFIYHSASFGLFLVLLILASTRTEGSERQRRNLRGPAPTVVEGLIFCFVFGMVWSECKQLWEEGLQAYIRQWWNWLDFIMLSLYLCTFSLRAVGFALIATNKYGPREIPRAQWPNNDPTLIAEGVFAVANVFSFARIIYLFQTNPHLGPLQISLGCMIIDIAKFLFIFFLVLTSFACGLNQLYWYYDSSEHCDSISTGGLASCQAGSDAFNTLDVTFSTLFWSLFGISSPKSTELAEEHVFIETVGQGLFMAYHVMSIIVLINMLIAMMSNSFQQIEDHADQEWKFARSQLWMSYFDPGSTLPAPFNLIISPKSVWYFLRGCKNVLVFLCRFALRKRRRNKRPVTIDKGMLQSLEENHNFFLKGPNASNKCRQSRRYAEVMRRLVSRYIHQAKKQHRQDGVSEDDLLEIKQDISSLRYELREDRKREAARAYGQMDSVKKDILRLLKQRSGEPASPTTTKKSLEKTVGHSSSQPPPCPSCSHSPLISPSSGEGADDSSDPYNDEQDMPNFRHGKHSKQHFQTQQSVDLGMLGRSPNEPPVIDITVTPATSLPGHLTYSQGNLSGCLLAPQEMDYLRKEIVRSLRHELRGMLKDALCKALAPTAQNSAPHCYSPTPTPSSTPQLSVVPTKSSKHKAESFSRAPTLEAPSSPLLSPTSAKLRVPHMTLNTKSGDNYNPHYSSNSGKNSVYRGPSEHSTSSPVLLCPITEGERVFNQMYTQI